MERKGKSGSLLLSLFLFVALAFLTGCGASKNSSSSFQVLSDITELEEAPMEMPEEAERNVLDFGNGFEQEEAGAAALTDRKLIKNVDLEVETLDYDTLTAGLEQKVEDFSGYVENSELSGNSIYSNGSTRYARYTVRIPKEQLELFIGSFSESCNVLSKRETVEDVTLQYVDTESRKKSLQVEQERLFALLEQADSIETVIALETRLSEVRYQIENYESMLRTYDNKVDYSTVTISVREVERITEPVQDSAWQRIRHGFSDNVFRLGKQIKELLIWLAVSVPYFAVLGIFILLVLLAVKGLDRCLKKRVKGRKSPDRIGQEQKKEK